MRDAFVGGIKNMDMFFRGQMICRLSYRKLNHFDNFTSSFYKGEDLLLFFILYVTELITFRFQTTG